MIWLLGGYIWLYVHRPFEIWSELGALQIERGYMLLMMLFWLVWPNKRLVPNAINLAIGALFGATVLSWMSSPYPAEGWLVVENYAKVMVFYLLLVTCVHNEQDLRRLMGMLVFSYVIYLLHSLREYLAGRYDYAQGVQRMMGVDVTFSDPNQFATCVLLSLPLVLAFLRGTQGFVRAALYGYIALSGICILLTCSRAGIVGYCFFLFLWVCVSKYRAAGFIGLIFLAMVASAAMPGYVFNRIMTLVDQEAGPEVARDSAMGRLAGFLKGFELLEQNPITGVGPGAFGLATGKGFQAHNLYGQVAGELGGLGLLALGALILLFFVSWRRAVRRGNEQPWLRETLAYRVIQGVGLGVLLLMLNGMAGHTLYRYNWAWLAAFQVVSLGVLQQQANLAWSEEPAAGWDGYHDPHPHLEPDPNWSY